MENKLTFINHSINPPGKAPAPGSIIPGSNSGEEEIIEEETLTGRIIKKRRSVAINPQVLIKALELKAKLDGLLDRVDQEEKDYQMVSIVDDLGDDS